MSDAPERIYYYKQYRRSQPGATGGELIKKLQIRAYGWAHAEQLTMQTFLPGINFETDFVILDGETGFATCWFSEPPKPR